jgi:hypothetical protein
VTDDVTIDLISEGDAAFQRAVGIPAHQARGAVVGPDVLNTVEFNAGVGKIVFVSEKDAVSAETSTSLLGQKAYYPGKFQFVTVPDVTLVNFPRTEGMMLDAEGKFIRETRGSPRIYKDNPYVRSTDGASAWFFRRELRADVVLERAFVGFDPASFNFAHFVAFYLPKVMLAAEILKDTPFLFPDLPDYATLHPGGMRNELFFGLSDIVPLNAGNFYSALPAGIYRIKKAHFIQHLGYRWDLIFCPDVIKKYRSLGEIASDRYYSLHGTRPPKKIFISRAGAMNRRIVNHSDVSRLLRSHDFVEIRLEAMTFWEQVAFFALAEVVVAPHGAGCANIMFNNVGGKLVEIFPRPLPMEMFVHATLARNGTYVALGCEPKNRQLDVEVNIDELFRALDCSGTDIIKP